jgi:PRTRC genetic system protein E
MGVLCLAFVENIEVCGNRPYPKNCSRSRIGPMLCTHARLADSRVNEQIKYSNKSEVASVPEEAIKALTTPVSITGTAEDIDAKFPAILCEYVESHVPLQETLDRASSEIAEAVKQSTSGTSPRLMVRLPHDYCFFFIGANATDDFPFARVTGTNSPRAIGLRASS